MHRLFDLGERDRNLGPNNQTMAKTSGEREENCNFWVLAYIMVFIPSSLIWEKSKNPIFCSALVLLKVVKSKWYGKQLLKLVVKNIYPSWCCMCLLCKVDVEKIGSIFFKKNHPWMIYNASCMDITTADVVYISQDKFLYSKYSRLL